mmetsp:Transcript_57482/g.95510  ORF Transcript_57482/g.95510 Transcript_57482/m.95510 type:complete len:242 (+) Transcript_57482:591-1316(+)
MCTCLLTLAILIKINRCFAWFTILTLIIIIILRVRHFQLQNRNGQIFMHRLDQYIFALSDDGDQLTIAVRQTRYILRVSFTLFAQLIAVLLHDGTLILQLAILFLQLDILFNMLRSLSLHCFIFLNAFKITSFIAVKFFLFRLQFLKLVLLLFKLTLQCIKFFFKFRMTFLSFIAGFRLFFQLLRQLITNRTLFLQFLATLRMCRLQRCQCCLHTFIVGSQCRQCLSLAVMTGFTRVQLLS